MIWNIVTDSSCDLHFLSTFGEPEIRYASVPFVISVGETDFIDDDSLSVETMLDAMEQEQQASHTSCPSPAVWMDAFQADGNVIAITISKELSGSHNSACAAKELILEANPEKNIAIINSVSTGPALILLIRKLCQSIQSGMSFPQVVEQARKDVENCRTVFALCSFDNLVKNGRVSRLVGFVARKLGLWGIGIGTLEGKIAIKGKARGSKKAISAILEDMKDRRCPTSSVVISHCQNQEMAEALKASILEQWHGLAVEVHETRGLCSYYAERHGLIVTYS